MNLTWCVFARASLHMRREEKATRCHCMHLRYVQHVSGTSMPIIRSSRLYVCICRLWCAVLGCWLSGVRCRAAGGASRKREYGTTELCSIPLPGRTPCCPEPYPRQSAAKTAHHRRQIHTYSLELLMMGIDVPETCWAYHKCNKAYSDI
jgi:hypothetical protein